MLKKEASAAEAERLKLKETDRLSKTFLVSCLSDECLEIVARRRRPRREIVQYVINLREEVRGERNSWLVCGCKKTETFGLHLLEFDRLVSKLKTVIATLAGSELVSQLFLTMPDFFDPLITT